MATIAKEVNLNAEQQRAVRAEGSVAVTAGAGTGKTAMLVERYVHHVKEHKLSPLEIVAVTFTEKAADELRARIRERMLDESNEQWTAEVDAAQISTIHAFAARVCRDFYQLAAIPANFSMMDETDAAIWLAGVFDEAIAALDTGIVERLGYTWLRSALRRLLADPFSSEEALKFGAEEWRKFIEDACRESIVELMSSDCWKAAAEVLPRYKGDDGDTLETRRVSVINAMADIAAGRDIANAFNAFYRFSAKNGAAGKWKNGGLDEIRNCLSELNAAFKNCKDAATMAFGDEDRELAARVELLRTAFADARDFLKNKKLERGVLDYGDLEYYALKILDNAEAREHYAARWKGILVDEFQDTNPVQEKLLRYLSAGARLTIVGDEKQSIYGFRRADTAVFGRVRSEINERVELARSYRTHSDLISPINKIFDEVLGSGNQRLAAERQDPPHLGPHIIAAIAEPVDGERKDDLRYVEAKFIAAEIAKLLSDGTAVYDKRSRSVRPVKPSDIAVLSRTRGPFELYISALERAGVRAVNTGGGDLLSTRVARDAMALLDLIADRDDDIALATVLRGPFFAVSDRELFDLSRRRQRDETWWDLITRAQGAPRRASVMFSRIYTLSRRLNAAEILTAFDEMTGFTAVLANLPEGERRMADWDGFVSLLRDLAGLGYSDAFSAARYLTKLREAETVIPRPQISAGDAVSVMTIHGSKGLEWPVVFVTDLSRGENNQDGTLSIDPDVGIAFKIRRPDETGKMSRVAPAVYTLIKRRAAEKESAEARRLLYVAVTRARDRVYLTAAGKIENNMKTLLPGLESAGVPLQKIAAETVPGALVTTPIKKKNIDARKLQVEALNFGISSIPVTGLAEYDACPRRFKYRYIDGHPGLSEGGTAAMAIGSLAHRALELDITNGDGLMPFNDEFDQTVIDDALHLAERFRTHETFSEFRIDNVRREVSVSLDINGATLNGIVDLVGDDFVLDYKTDSEIEPRHHLLQLWVYAQALSKPRAVLAYLRHDQVHSFSVEDLAAARSAVTRAVSGIVNGVFRATASVEACARCSYSAICDERHKN